jgi:peptidoglycan/xylan/chitin deacetylase (PgdA/CDA1 family)
MRLRLIFLALATLVATPLADAKEAYVTFTFDDAPKSVAEVGLPILEKYGFPATVYISTRNTTFEGYMDWDDIAKVANAGWEIGAHSHTHPHLTKVTDTKIREELETSTKWFREHGYTPISFVPPYGDINPKVMKFVKEYYKTMRTGFPHAYNTVPPKDWYNLAAYDVGDDIALADLSTMFDDLQRDGGWVILVMHHVTPPGEDLEHESDTNLLDEIAKMVKERGISVLTVEGALNQFSNK